MSRKICILSNDQELKIFKETNRKLDDFTFILVGSNFQMNNLQNLKFFFLMILLIIILKIEFPLSQKNLYGVGFLGTKGISQITKVFR